MRLLDIILSLFSILPIRYAVFVHFLSQYQQQHQSIGIAEATSVTYPLSKPITSFCSGSYHSCAVFEYKSIKCYGSLSSWGESGTNLGDSNDELGISMPYVDIGDNVTILKIKCGSQHVCMLLGTGNIKCLGNNSGGQIGIGNNADIIGSISGHVGNKLPSVNVGFGIEVLDFTLGNLHTCIVASKEHTVKCYGKNDVGQLGIGNQKDLGIIPADMGDRLPFVDLGTNVTVSLVQSGVYSNHNCAILLTPIEHAQRIKCWGRNHAYQLGYGDISNRGDQSGEMGNNLPMVDLGNESRVKNFSLGFGFSCAILISNDMKCWGAGGVGQLGSGSNAVISSKGNAIPIVKIDKKMNALLLSTGQDHTCIVLDDAKTMKCFGRNTYGQLGQGNIANLGLTPNTTIPNIPAIDLGVDSMNITSIHSGIDFNCVVFESLLVKCFGDNSYGQCGVGTGANIGDGEGEMGKNLKYAVLFSSPLTTPIPMPSKVPTVSPTVVKISNTSAIGFAVAFSILAFMIIVFICIKKNPRNKRRIENATRYRQLQPAAEQRDITVYLSFSSNESNEILTEIQDLVLSQVIDSDQLVIGPKFNRFDDVEDHIRRSKAVIVILTKTVLENVMRLMEIYIAIKLDIHIYLIYVTDAGYELTTTIELFNQMLAGYRGSLKTLKEIEAMKIDYQDVANTLISKLPDIKTIRYVSDDPEYIRTDNIEKLISIVNDYDSKDIVINYSELGMKRLADIFGNVIADKHINSAFVDDFNGDDIEETIINLEKVEQKRPYLNRYNENNTSFTFIEV